ncbi:MAG: YkvA family protein [Acidimicrobiales bacterium]
MDRALRVVAVGLALLLASWALLAFAAKRLPPGTARDLATVLPACLTTARRLRRDPRVPRSAKVAVAIAGLWLLSPIDLIPEFLPIVGPLDDVIVIALALRFAARRTPREVLVEAWPAEERILTRLLGAPAP